MNLDMNNNLNYLYNSNLYNSNLYNSNNNSPTEFSRLYKYTNNIQFSNPPSPDKYIAPKMETFYLDNYIISLSLNTINNCMYMIVKNNIDDTIYEGNIDINELNSPFKNEDTYKIILNFLGKIYYSNISFNISLNIFYLNINFMFNNILETSFILKVPIKNNNTEIKNTEIKNTEIKNTEIKNTELDTYIKKNDQENIIIKQNIEKLYQSFNKSISHLDKELKNQKKIFDSKLEEQQNDFNKQLSELKTKYDNDIYNLNNKLINQYEDIDLLNDIVGNIDIKINRYIPSKNTQSSIFFPLNSIEINISYPINLEKIRFFIHLEKLTIQLSEDSINFENNTVKHVVFNGGNIISIKGINKIPNVEILEFHYCSLLDDVKAHLNNTKIKKIVFIKCGDYQKRNMINYCKAKNIELSFN
jgi:hypothetical protein